MLKILIKIIVISDKKTYISTKNRQRKGLRTVRQLLLEYSSGKISVDYGKNGYVITNNNSDWNENSPYLPKEDSYMYAEDGEFEDEIHYFLI